VWKCIALSAPDDVVCVGSATVSFTKIIDDEVLQRQIQASIPHSNNLQGGIDDVDSAIRTKQYMVKSDIKARERS